MDQADDEQLPQEHWLKSWWRPAMAIQYLVVCLFDFIFFPGIYAAIFANGGQYHEWKPLTLANGGLYHASMGAIVGIYAYQRSKEKIAQMSSGSTVIERSSERSSTTSPNPDTPDRTTVVETTSISQPAGQTGQSGRAD